MKKAKDGVNISQLAVNTIKTLSIDGVQKANSGHPGMPMGAADYTFVLWNSFLRYNPDDPQWPDRDRFVLSPGHGSMLLYSMLHLAGFGVTIEDLKNFRQLGSRTPGHPEYGRTPGVETTTGPLGQGFANGVGMAIASRTSAERFNTEKHSVVNNRIFGIVSDGDIMEGISTEAASLAGHLKLGNLIYIYDDNKITIDGKTDLTFSEDVQEKFMSLGWKVIRVNGHDHDAITRALDEAVNGGGSKPKLIIAETHIANGSPGKQDTSASHGSPLGVDEVRATKDNIGWTYKKDFFVPSKVYDLFNKRTSALKKDYNKWKKTMKAWEKANPGLAKKRASLLDGGPPANLEKKLLKAIPDKVAATRAFSGVALQEAARLVPGLTGGSADLAPSNKTHIDGEAAVCPDDFTGRNFHFGIREHAMGAIMNGMSLYGGCIPYGGTFLVFADYMRTPIRLAGLMNIQVIYVFTHDSFYVGEDGPTHQPIEHVCSLRSIPGLHVFRPADGPETALAWAAALRRKDGPSALCLTRQGVPVIERAAALKPATFARGAYVVSESESAEPGVVALATGSEVGLLIEAKKLLGAKGACIRVVSMPCLELFDAQPESYRNKLIPAACDKIVAVEAGVEQGWHKYAGRKGLVIGMTGFGESAPGKALADHFGFTPEKVAARIKDYFSL